MATRQFTVTFTAKQSVLIEIEVGLDEEPTSDLVLDRAATAAQQHISPSRWEVWDDEVWLGVHPWTPEPERA